MAPTQEFAKTHSQRAVDCGCYVHPGWPWDNWEENMQQELRCRKHKELFTIRKSGCNFYVDPT